MATEDRYQSMEAEPRLQSRWAELGIHQFNPQESGPIFAVDTPPTTVSGQIHIGHVFSYTQTDIAVRYHRMHGERVFYPFGYDDNGLPTERFTEQKLGITAREVGREAFIQACLALSAQVEERFERFWKRLGFSADWRLRYSTIDPRCRRIAQEDFLDLHERGLATRRLAPGLWCPECATALAQADVEDREDVPSIFVTLRFAGSTGEDIPVATTRPELLPACGAVFVHPDDPRYAHLIGSTVLTPLFGQPVPVLADRGAQRDKGTGAVMCCTFGDISDVRWWREHDLPLRIAITADGKMDDSAGPCAGLTIAAARAQIITDLAGAGLVVDRKDITHTVGVHERCGTPVEFQVTAQWFIELLAHREQLLEAGRAVAWHPPYMRARYESWIEGLAWDWSISRRRYHGVPFPVWYCDRCGAVVTARRADLPVDPTASAPPSPCPACGADTFTPDPDVMDTWATSSLTPRICASLAEELALPEQDMTDAFSPMAMRPNAHDIIRTWDFYTVARNLLRGDPIPWRDLVISGHGQDPAGKKLSKSKLKAAEDPTALIERWSADAVRYWTAGARTGADTILSEDAFRQGSRLATKLWNAARFVGMYAPLRPDAPSEGPTLTDRVLLHRLGRTVEQATAAMDEYDLFTARSVVERFFWSDLCDTYLELVKRRLADPGTEGHHAAARTLRTALLTTLKLFAPFLPHVTEEIYLRDFAEGADAVSIHVTAWPAGGDFPADPEAEQAGEAVHVVVDAVRRWKAEHNLSVGAPLSGLEIGAPSSLIVWLAAMQEDLHSITRAEQIRFTESESLTVAFDCGEDQ
jgi:valyl-tRNA synthetase